ncbi:MAG: hypothetical protein JEY79_12430 [Pseudodesulfovibrio sp.]|nr:hypothetical protein [Pseudodesulfovibrio sp.]
MVDSTTALIISTGVLSGAFSVIVNQVWDSSRTRDKKKSEAVYGSSRLAIILEEFALDCVRAVQDTRDALSPHGPTTAHGTLPKLTEYPVGITWEAIKPDLMNRVLSLPNQISLSNGHIQTFNNYVDSSPNHEDTYYECTFECIMRGNQALQLADDLRREYGINQSSLDEHWVREFLEEEYPAVERRNAERYEQSG